MFKIVQAYFIARKAHKGQLDKAGAKYIKHPVSVSKQVKGRDAKIVALLHDVVEDGNVSIDFIRKQFGATIANAVKLLTHDKTIPYAKYISFIKTNKLATTVKIADLKHNMNLSRLKTITLDDIKRVKKYISALEELISAYGN